MKKINIGLEDIKIIEEALKNWQTMGISISGGERGVLDETTKARWMSEVLAVASPVLSRMDLTTNDFNFGLERNRVAMVESVDKLETLQALGVEMMRADIPIVRRNGGDLAVNATTEKMRRALTDVASMESVCASVRESIRQTAENRSISTKDVVMELAPSLLEFRIDGLNYDDVELAVVTILASRLKG